MVSNSVTGREVYLTQEGLARMRAEVKELIEVRRPVVAKMIQDAKESGDISDNAAFEDAKHEQGILEGKIQDLEWKIRNAIIITDTHSPTVTLGSTVRVKDARGSEVVYTIVGSSEARPSEGRISNESPVGKALLGHRPGDAVEVRLPKADKPVTYTLLAIN
jgi:transcription elongation factor GreA